MVLPGGDNGTWIARLRYALIAAGASVVFALFAYLPVILRNGFSQLTSSKYTASVGLRQTTEGIPTIVTDIGGLLTYTVPLVLALGLVAGLALAYITPWDTVARSLAWSTMIGILAVLFLQRSVPPERIWLAVLPIVGGLAIAGAASLRALIPKRDFPRREITILIAVSLTAILSASAVSRDSLVHDTSGSFDDAEAIVSEIAPNLTDETWVISSAAPHIRYYFLAHGIDTSPLWKPDAVATIFVIVRDGQDVTEVIGDADLVVADQPILVRRFASGSVWRLDLGTTATTGQRSRP
jgi:hypothetical protein